MQSRMISCANTLKSTKPSNSQRTPKIVANIRLVPTHRRAPSIRKALHIMARLRKSLLVTLLTRSVILSMRAQVATPQTQSKISQTVVSGPPMLMQSKPPCSSASHQTVPTCLATRTSLLQHLTATNLTRSSNQSRWASWTPKATNSLRRAIAIRMEGARKRITIIVWFLRKTRWMV